MKKLLLPLVMVSMALVSCKDQTSSNASENETQTMDSKELLYYFGDSIITDGAKEASNLPELIAGVDTLSVKLNGVIEEVCQVKGCWMTMKVGDDEMRISFKDYGFFMPKDAAGKNVIIEGLAYRDTTSIEALRHYAEDAGKSEEEISAITEPEISLSFEAFGVIIKDEE